MTGTEPEALASVNLAMQAMLVAWVALVVLIVRRTIAAGSVGLPAAMVLAMSFLYGGAFVYAMPGYTHLRPDGHWYLRGLGFTEDMVVQATLLSLLALLAFAIGAGAFTRTVGAVPTAPSRPSWPRLRRASAVMALIGLATYVIMALDISFPMVGAVSETGQKVALAAICAGFLQARLFGRPILGWIIAAGIIAAFYVVIFAHAAHGFLIATILGCFWLAQMGGRRRSSGLRQFVLIGLTIYVALTLFVGWFSFRDELRRVVWGGQGSLVDVLWQGAAGIEWFSPWNARALDLINIRLNLNYFIGRMMAQHELYPELRQYGATLVILPLVLVPRFLWPDKPERGGSSFMSDNTGIHLSESTTFGTGSVFEFYVNFGHVGVFVGFLVLGWLIRRIDRIAAGHLLAGRYLEFGRLFVTGTICIDPLLRPFFMVNGMVFSWILMTLVIAFFAPGRSQSSGRERSGLDLAGSSPGGAPSVTGAVRDIALPGAR